MSGKREVLFTDGDWSVVRRLNDKWGRSIVEHKCGKRQRYGMYMENGCPNRCGYCDVSVPSGIVSLWTLHNWDWATGARS